MWCFSINHRRRQIFILLLSTTFGLLLFQIFGLISYSHIPFHDSSNLPSLQLDPQSGINTAGPAEDGGGSLGDEAECANMRGAERIVVAVKTGATVIDQRLSRLLKTSMACAPNVHIFSDMEQEFEGHVVHDALKSMSSTVKGGNSDFDLYRAQYRLQKQGKSVVELQTMMTPDKPSDLAAWTLDKYKNLHILEDVWNLQPHRDWYLFIDADTYVFWPTLLHWTASLNPEKIQYLGARTWIGDLVFAHGGSGYLLSKGAMRRVVTAGVVGTSKWDLRAAGECCGDALVALALKEEFGIEMTKANPVISGYHINDIPFDKNVFCRPLATLHHISEQQYDEIFKFEAPRRRNDQPILYKDVYDHFVAGEIKPEREHWDNLSQGEEGLIDAHSLDECRQACVEEVHCTQARWNGKQCVVEVDRITLGDPSSPDGEGWDTHSIWNQSRIDKWVKRQGPCSWTYPGDGV